MPQAAKPDLSRNLAKLMRRAPLSEEAQQAFLGLPARREIFAPYRDIIREGEPTARCCFVEEGLVSRYKLLRNGGRQIVSFHIPGDLVDLQSSLVKVSDHGIRTHTASVLHTVPCKEVLDLAVEFPELALAFWFETLADGAIFREWTLNVGRRGARERTAHLLLEFAYRLREIGQSDGREFDLLVTQADFADAVGLSPVHVNRSFQSLRADSLIRTFKKTVVIEDMPAMIREADFRPGYLHPEGSRSIELGEI
jgi:CRP-like cAMP-binding protein